MPTLPEVLNSDAKREAVIRDCLELLDREVGDRGGLTGLAIKGGYKAVKGIKPGFIREAVERLLPPFAEALDPIFQEAQTAGTPVSSHFEKNSTRVADALLAITDARAAKADGGLVKSTYQKLRPMAKKNVEQAVPRLGKLIEKHASSH
jgi:hypothetical protein